MKRLQIAGLQIANQSGTKSLRNFCNLRSCNLRSLIPKKPQVRGLHPIRGFRKVDACADWFVADKLGGVANLLAKGPDELPSSMAIERRRVYFGGRVQGVGFRMTALRLASGLPVVGFARNLDDGRVELVVEGDSAVVSGFLGAILREFGDSIRDQDETLEPVGVPPFAGFSIR